MDQEKDTRTEESGEKQGATPEELADVIEETTEALGGRANVVQRFSKVTVQLSKPFTWCGKTYETVELDFESLTGRDMEAIDEMIGNFGLRGMIPSYSRTYQRLLSAKASGIPSDALEALPLVDYNAIVGAAQRFLLITG